jgi:phosphoribosylglycinamide formyltransferase-1
MKAETGQKFISESIRPVATTAVTNDAATGGPVLPGEFVWRGNVLGIASVLRTWHDTGPCRNGSPELYVRKHWFEVETTAKQRAKIYFERQPRGGKLTKRWWLYSMENKIPPEGTDKP